MGRHVLQINGQKFTMFGALVGRVCSLDRTFCAPRDPSVTYQVRKREEKIRQGAKSVGPRVVGREVPVMREEYERPCEIHEEGTFYGYMWWLVFV